LPSTKSGSRAVGIRPWGALVARSAWHRFVLPERQNLHCRIPACTAESRGRRPRRRVTPGPNASTMRALMARDRREKPPTGSPPDRRVGVGGLDAGRDRWGTSTSGTGGCCDVDFSDFERLFRGPSDGRKAGFDHVWFLRWSNEDDSGARLGGKGYCAAGRDVGGNPAKAHNARLRRRVAALDESYAARAATSVGLPGHFSRSLDSAARKRPSTAQKVGCAQRSRLNPGGFRAVVADINGRDMSDLSCASRRRPLADLGASPPAAAPPAFSAPARAAVAAGVAARFEASICKTPAPALWAAAHENRGIAGARELLRVVRAVPRGDARAQSRRSNEAETDSRSSPSRSPPGLADVRRFSTITRSNLPSS